MHFVGIDLAWGERKPTGIAVLDDTGRLLRVAAVRTDAEIVAEVEPYVSGDCLVGIDAPLVVPNATGNRPAEADLNRDFARFQAGAHPSNTGKPEFSGTPRGAALCARLGLDMNPRSRRKRRAIEVYPHPAIVALFRLGRTLKYKNKPGRAVADLRSELLVLMGLLSGLERAEPPLILDAGWSELLAAVDAATRKSELRVVEDQVDAVVCAYVALFAVRRPDLTTTYGDFATGYIVTPTLPPDLRPEIRSRTAVADPISAAVRAYADLRPELIATGERLLEQITGMLDDAGINYLTVSGRIKSVASFADKAARLADGQMIFPDPLQDIGDQIGVRVITYVQSDVATVADLLHDQLVVHDDRDRGRETARLGQFGYASRHLQVSTPSPRSASDGEPIAGRIAQIQIRTVLQHAWAEFEHDIRYKGTIPAEHASDFDRRFTLAAGLLELADNEFSTIRDRLRTEVPESTGADPHQLDDDPRLSPRELAAFLAGQYADAGWSRTEHYAWISGLLLELGITSLAELADTLRGLDEGSITARMGYRYPPGAVRRLDDALLFRFGDRYVGLRGNADRMAALQSRWKKISTA